VPCEKKPENDTTAPFVQWARLLMEYRPFKEWDAERIARMVQEKKIACMPVEQWDGLIASHEITDRISIMATAIAKKWIAFVKPPSSPRKTYH
jgi:hypothetical protein